MVFVPPITLLPELYSGTTPYCLQWFPSQWVNQDGSPNFDETGTPVMGLPIVGWRVWTNATNWVSSKGNTSANPLLNFPNRPAFILWYHQKPYRTTMAGIDPFPLPDGTTRRAATQMSDTAFNNILNNLNTAAMLTWPQDDQ